MNKFKLCIVCDLKFEVWKEIEDHHGYFVSNYGRVYSSTSNKIMSNRISQGGYQYVSFPQEGKNWGKNEKVHRLVAKAFCPKWKNEYVQINHINEVVTDNTSWNLEWCTALYNNHYGNRRKKQSEAMLGHKDTEETRYKKSIHHMGSMNAKSKPVLQYTKEMVLVKEWESANQIQREYGWSSGNITQCCNLKKGYYTAYGYVWRFK